MFEFFKANKTPKTTAEKKPLELDPMETMRTSTDDLDLALMKEYGLEIENYEPTEDEELIFKNDPTLQLNDHEIALSTDTNSDFASMISDTEYIRLPYEEKQDPIITRGSLLDIPKYIIDEQVIGAHINPDYLTDDEIPFEDRDIMADRRSEYSKQQERETNQESVQKEESEFGQKLARKEFLRKKGELLDYSKAEFKMMKSAWLAHELKQQAKNLEKIATVWPSFTDDKPLSVKQIMEQVEKFKQAKLDNDFNRFSDEQKNLMTVCHTYAQALDTIDRSNQPVMGLDQNVLSDDEIAELANEYCELRDNNFVGFVKQQVEAGIWKLKDFNWKKDSFKGKDQWTSHGLETVSGKKIKTKYISMKEPLPIENNSKLYAYSTLFEKVSGTNNDFMIQGIETYSPRKKKVTNKETASV